jgi:DNA modification methylase
VTPYYEHAGVRIFQGDCRKVLSTLPDDSIHCVVTSPPYWGLRDYKLEASVWGGDAGCRHEWGEAVRTPWANAVPGPNGRGKNTEAGHWKPKETGPFCSHCNAWRGCLGLEPTPELYVEHLVQVFREVRRVLRGDGTVWCNLGDSYVSHKPRKAATHRQSSHIGDQTAAFEAAQSATDLRGKGILKDKDLCGIPWRAAFALQADGWYLRSDIIWSKPNPMPESVTDRPTKAHEYVFLLTKSAKYYFDQEAVREQSVTNDPRRPYTSQGAKDLDGRETWHSGQRRDGSLRSWSSR